MTIGLKYKHLVICTLWKDIKIHFDYSSHVIKCTLVFSAVVGKIRIWKGFLGVQHSRDF